jgi:HlyD family secretion protein
MENDITKNDLEQVEKEAAKGLKKTLGKIRKAKKRTKIILGIILIIVLVIVGFIVFREKESPYEIGEVMRGNVIEEVSATGEVELAEEVDLRFKTSGIVERINVKVGDVIRKGAYLLQLSSGDVQSQFLQAQASYNQAKAKLDQLLAGATTEEIKVAEQVLENAKIALEDAKAEADNDLQQDYNSALVELVNASSKCNKALADLKDMETTYFYRSTSLDNTFREKRNSARGAFEDADELVDIALEDPIHENIDLALMEIKAALEKIIDALDYAKTAMGDPSLRENIEAGDKTTIDADITNTNTAYSNINDAQADIANQKIANQTDINTAESTHNKAQADLEELKAPPRAVDIAIFQADVEKYRANMSEFSQKVRDASIVAPFDGIVAKIDARIGEVVSANDKVVASLIAPGSFQIRSAISEADIRKVGSDNSAEIVLDAFPEQSWLGQIIEIEPGETVIDGVVYYRVKVLFERVDEKIKSGMSADVTIHTNERKNVLYVSQRSIVYKEDKRFVRIPKGEEFEETEVETGLKGSDGRIEIISGVDEGTEVIVFIKK